MSAQAARRALDDAGISAQDIDMIICTTVSPSFYTPSTACIIQGDLGIPEAIALDINVACTGLCFALDMAHRYLQTGDVSRVLLISAEELTQLANYSDRSTCVLFGDGAGACVVEQTQGIYGSFQSSDATGAKHLYAAITRKPNPFSKNDAPPLPFPVAVEEFLDMNGQEVYKFATKAMPAAIEKACAKAGITPEDITLILPHQANYRILETAAKHLKIDPSKIHVNIQEYGNTSSASIAICLDEVCKSGKIARGDIICLVGFGAGLTYGATVFQY